MQITHLRLTSTAGAPVLVAFLWMLSALTVANEAAGSDREDPHARRNWTAATEDATRKDASPDDPASAREVRRLDKQRTEPWLTTAIDAPHLQRHLFHSTAARGEVSCHVYTPDAYDAEPDRRFPAVYWLHGPGGGTDGMLSRLVLGSRDNTLPFNRDFDKHLTRLGIPHTLHVVPDVGHHPIDLLSAFGDVNWIFYRQAFGATQARPADDEPRTHVLLVGKARFVDPPQQQERAADAVRRVAEATSRLGPRILVDPLSETVMTREQVLGGEASECVTGSVFLTRLTQLAETTGAQDTVIIYTHTHGVKRGVANPNSPGGIVLDSPFRRFGHRGVLAWDEYVEHILLIPAKNVVVLTMSCFSGGLVHYLESPPVKAQWEHRQQEGRNLVVLTSQDRDTVSPPIVVDCELVNPFTYAVAKAFEGAADGFRIAGGKPSKLRSGDGQLAIGEFIDCVLDTTQHTPSESPQRPNIARPQVTGTFSREEVLGRFAGTSGGGENTEPAPADLLSPGRHALSLAVEGRQRSYLVHVPPRTDRATPLPVVIMFHGGGGNAESARREAGWDRKADRDGFLAVFPEGTPPDPSRPGRFIGNPQTWNDGSARDLAAVRRGTPDVAFVEAPIKDLKTRCPVDERRIYATGFSNGASMAFRLARERADLVAAVAPVAGVQPARAVPLLYITGTADPLNPLEGGDVAIGTKRYGQKPPIEEMLGRWVKLHDCRPTPRTVFDQDGAKGHAYGCPDAADLVVFYTLDGHGHHWPGSKSLLPRRIAGPNNAQIRATDVIWAFFEQHTRPLPKDGE